MADIFDSLETSTSSNGDIFDTIQPEKSRFINSISRPFKAQTYSSLAGLEEGGASLYKGVANISDYLSKKVGIGPVFNKASDILHPIVGKFQSNAEYYKQKAKEVGANPVDTFLGEAIGGAVPGIVDFVTDIYGKAFLKGVAESESESQSKARQLWSGATEQVKVLMLKKALDTAGILKKLYSVPTAFGIGTAQAISEGAELSEAARGGGTLALYQMFGKGGKVGLRELTKTGMKPIVGPTNAWEDIGKSIKPTESKGVSIEPTIDAINRVQGIQPKQPYTPMSAEEAKSQAIHREMVDTIKGLVSDTPVVNAEKSASTFTTVEGKIQELQALIKNAKGIVESERFPISEEVTRKAEAARNVGLKAQREVAKEMAIESGKTHTDFLSKEMKDIENPNTIAIINNLRELDKLREEAAKIAGSGIRPVYDTVIDNMVKSLPDDIRLEVEKQRVLNPAERTPVEIEKSIKDNILNETTRIRDEVQKEINANIPINVINQVKFDLEAGKSPIEIAGKLGLNDAQVRLIGEKLYESNVELNIDYIKAKKLSGEKLTPDEVKFLVDYTKENVSPAQVEVVGMQKRLAENKLTMSPDKVVNDVKLKNIAEMQAKGDIEGVAKELNNLKPGLNLNEVRHNIQVLAEDIHNKKVAKETKTKGSKKPSLKEALEATKPKEIAPTAQSLSTTTPINEIKIATIDDVPGIEDTITMLEAGDKRALTEVKMLASEYGKSVFEIIGNNMPEVTAAFKKIKPQYDKIRMGYADVEARPLSEPITVEEQLRPAQIRKAKEELTKEEGPSESDLKEIERENLSKDDLQLLKDVGMDIEEDLIDIRATKSSEKLPSGISGKDVMVFRYLKERHGDNALKMFEKLTPRGKENIWNDINLSEDMYERYGGKTENESTGDLLRNEEGFIALGDIVDVVKKVKNKIKDNVTLDILPKLSRFSIKAVDVAVEHASAKMAVDRYVKSMIANALPKHYKNPQILSMFKDLLNKDNILDGYDSFIEKSRVAEAAGKEAEAIKWLEAAKNITEKHDLVSYDKDIKTALNDPEIVEGMKGLKAEINKVMDELYSEVKRLDPNTEWDGRGKYFGVRTNLVTKELADRWSQYSKDDRVASPEFPAAGNYRNPNVKHDPFDIAAKFTGDYSTDFEASLKAVLSKRYNEATKVRLYNSLIKEGIVIEEKPGVARPENINGREVGALPIKVPETGVDGVTKQKEKVLYVPKELIRELKGVLDTDMRIDQVGLFKALNQIQLAQAVDAVYHIKNLVTEIGRAQGAGNVWKDLARKVPALGTVDAVGRIQRVMNEVTKDTPEIRRELSSMARQGWVRGDQVHIGLPKKVGQYIEKIADKSDVAALKKLGEVIGEGDLGELIYKIDTAGRIVMNRFYSNLVEQGLAKETVSARRAFNNQLGNYNRRLMGTFMRIARDSGIAPFIVAGRNFNRQGIRNLTGSAGVEAVDTKASMKLRVVNIAGTVMTLSVLPAIINMVTVGDPNGRSGVGIGEIDLGLAPDEKGKIKTWDLASLGSLRRGMRLTGVQALTQGIDEGQDFNTIWGQAKDEAVRGVTHPWTGPAFRFAAEAGLGWDIESNKGKYAPLHIRAGGGAQVLEDFRAAGESLNPLIYSLVRPTLVDLGIDKKPLDDEKGPISTLLQAPSGAFGLREKGSSAYQEMTRMFRNRGIQTEVGPEKLAERKIQESIYQKPDEEAATILNNALESKIIDEDTYDRLLESKDEHPLVRGFKALGSKHDTIYEAINVWKRATPEEKRMLALDMMDKLDNAWDDVPEGKEQEFLDSVRKVEEEISQMSE